ncbi:hypothetical protein VaNZ11_006174 [Volvox africanus]|uniref:Uncharacterized protein n=1 Tax=Volvox africanus TaxID=51714 RepID=A0ABQ5S0L8_9CHLO|nr:hypothetical protein VaNZ11_006174 [Volvox africanus]
MSDYKKQADRLRTLRQIPQHQQSHSLQLPPREPVQAEYHRAPTNVNALVQRHYFPAEGAVSYGVGEPAIADISDAADAADRLSKYQSICHRRAAEASRAMKAERDAKLKLAVSAQERSQAAKAFGVRVALSNLKASPSNPGPRKAISQQDPGESGASCMGSGPTCPNNGLEEGPQGPLGCGEEATNTNSNEVEVGGSEPAAAATPEHISCGEAPVPPTALDPIPMKHGLDAPPQAARLASVSMSARLRLASHSKHAAMEVARVQVAEGPQCTANMAIEHPPAIKGTRNEAKAFKTRVLQPANPNLGAKAYKGKVLPVAISVTDVAGLSRVAQKVSEISEKLDLPRLCACPNNATIFDPTYVNKCARNCPLYHQPERYERLLTTWLREKNII